ncbi:MAG: hypothetical protein WCE72_01530, partial [Pseudolabrys sp.]
MAKVTIAGGLGARINAGYGAHRHSVFLAGWAEGALSYPYSRSRRFFDPAAFRVVTMLVCYRIERVIVILSSIVPLHGDAKASAIMRESNSEGRSHVDQSKISA